MYEAEISRKNPTCFIFLVDQSGSMQEPWSGDQTRRKADELAVILNRLLQNLTIRCAKGEEIRAYYDVGVIGYGATVGSALGGVLTGRDMVSISELGNNPIRVDTVSKQMSDGAGGIVVQDVKLPVWVDPVTANGTPMTAAFEKARDILTAWVSQHPESFPPIVINISDGAPTDGDPREAAAAITQLATSDGSVLVFNVHISSQVGTAIEYPPVPDGLPDDHARLLFAMSSALPPYMLTAAAQEELHVGAGSRGFVFQADAVAVIKFLQIGTRPANIDSPETTQA